METASKISAVRHFIETIRQERNFKMQANYFRKNPKDIDELIGLAGSNEAHPVPEYASWILTHLPNEGLDLSPWKNTLTTIFLETKKQPVLRSVTRVLCKTGVSTTSEAAVFDRCISIISDGEQKVAAQAFCLHLLIPMVKKYPELRSEVLETARLHAEGKSPAYSTALRRFTKQTA